MRRFTLLLLSITLQYCTGQNMESIPSSPVVKRPGESLSLSCRGSGFTFSCCVMIWVRETSGKPLELLGTGFSDPSRNSYASSVRGRVEISREDSNSLVYLRFSNLKPEDSAVYYCARYGLGYAFDVWGKGTTVTVEPVDSPQTPSLFVLSPLSTPFFPLKSADDLGPNVCLVTNFRPKGGDVVLNGKGGPDNVNTDGAVLSKDNTYNFAAFSNETIYSCGMNGTFANNEADDECGSIYPEKAKLNFYLLLMNGVRVVFTKALAFSTILTIKGLLF